MGDASMSSSEVKIDVRLLNVSGSIIDNTQGENIEPKFDVNVKLEEVDRNVDEAIFNFAIAMNTKPSVVRFELNGIVNVLGKSRLIDKLLETDPETKVPHLLKKIYQRVFISIFLLSGLMGAPHPPPDLLFLSVKNNAGESSEEVKTEK